MLDWQPTASARDSRLIADCHAVFPLLSSSCYNDVLEKSTAEGFHRQTHENFRLTVA